MHLPHILGEHYAGWTALRTPQFLMHILCKSLWLTLYLLIMAREEYASSFDSVKTPSYSPSDPKISRLITEFHQIDASLLQVSTLSNFH